MPKRTHWLVHSSVRRRSNDTCRDMSRRPTSFANAMRIVTIFAVLLTNCTSTQQATRPTAFWRELKASKFALAPGVEAETVFRDSEALLGEPDPELRDEVGYALSVAWVLKDHRLSVEALRAHVDRLAPKLGAPGASLSRSFAALRLSVVAAADLQAAAPVLDEGRLSTLVDASASALTLETDFRGYDRTGGWVHATAHVADLMKALAKNPRLTPAQQTQLASAVINRLDHGPPFAWAEDERLAQVLRWLALRPDSDSTVVNAWLSTRGAAWQALWSASRLDEPRYTALNNTKLVLRALFFYLSAEEHPTEQVAAFKQRVFEACAAML